MKLNMIVSAAVICFGITNCGKKDKTEPQPENNVEAVQCSYNIDGELHQGSSKAECEALAEELGLNDLSFSGTVVCQVNVNGEIFDGNSQDECKEVFESLGLEIDFTDFFEREKAPKTPEAPKAPEAPKEDKQGDDDGQQSGDVYKCSYNINGTLYEGDSQEECDALKAKFGQPSPEVEDPTPAPSTDTVYVCSYNINGVLFEGDTQEECEALKKELGL